MEDLSKLALRFKAHWGYDDEFLDACREELTVTVERLRDEVVRLGEEGRFHSWVQFRSGRRI